MASGRKEPAKTARSAKGKKAASPKTKKSAVRKAAPKPSRVPAAPKRARPASPPNGKIFGSSKDVRILVADDEPEVLELLVPFLRTKGYTVGEAQDGDQALEKILTERPHIVVLDVMMPGLNGWEISRYVRERSELDPVRIIMATGIGAETNAATSPLYGADAYLDKPFRLEALERTIREVIRKIEAGRT